MNLKNIDPLRSLRCPEGCAEAATVGAKKTFDQAGSRSLVPDAFCELRRSTGFFSTQSAARHLSVATGIETIRPKRSTFNKIISVRRQSLYHRLHCRHSGCFRRIAVVRHRKPRSRCHRSALRRNCLSVQSNWSLSIARHRRGCSPLPRDSTSCGSVRQCLQRRFRVRTRLKR